MIVCSNCGTQNPDGSAFCANCGSAVSLQSDQVQPQPVPGQQAATSSKAAASLILGILGLFVCGPLTSIPGIIVGKQELNAIEAGTASPANKSLAQAGYWVSVGVTILWALVVIFYVVVIVLIMGAASVNM